MREAEVGLQPDHGALTAAHGEVGDADLAGVAGAGDDLVGADADEQEGVLLLDHLPADRHGPRRVELVVPEHDPHVATEDPAPLRQEPPVEVLGLVDAVLGDGRRPGDRGVHADHDLLVGDAVAVAGIGRPGCGRGRRRSGPGGPGGGRATAGGSGRGRTGRGGSRRLGRRGRRRSASRRGRAGPGRRRGAGHAGGRRLGRRLDLRGGSARRRRGGVHRPTGAAAVSGSPTPAFCPQAAATRTTAAVAMARSRLPVTGSRPGLLGHRAAAKAWTTGRSWS